MLLYHLNSHPSGFFRRGDNSQLSSITRKARNRSTAKRRASTSSAVSNDHSDGSPPPPLPAQTTWQPPDFRPQNAEERQGLPSLLAPRFSSPFGPPPALQHAEGSSSGSTLVWKPYSPTGWTQASTSSRSHEPTDDVQHRRRTSVSDYKISATGLISPRTSKPELELLPPPTLVPKLHKSASSLAMGSYRQQPQQQQQQVQTVDYAHDDRHHQAMFLPPRDDQSHASGSHSSPYPTPTFTYNQQPSYYAHEASGSSSSVGGSSTLASGLPVPYDPATSTHSQASTHAAYLPYNTNTHYGGSGSSSSSSAAASTFPQHHHSHSHAQHGQHPQSHAHSHSHSHSSPYHATNPLPSPTYSDGGAREHGSDGMMDPRALTIGGSSSGGGGGGGQYFAPKPTATTSVNAIAAGWAPPPLKTPFASSSTAVPAGRDDGYSGRYTSGEEGAGDER